MLVACCTESCVFIKVSETYFIKCFMFRVPCSRAGEGKEAEHCSEVQVSSVKHTYTESYNMSGPGNEQRLIRCTNYSKKCSLELHCSLWYPLATCRYQTLKAWLV